MFLTPKHNRDDKAHSFTGSRHSVSNTFKHLTAQYDQMRSNNDSRKNSNNKSRYNSPSAINRRSQIIQIDKNLNHSKQYNELNSRQISPSRCHTPSRNSTPKNNLNDHSITHKKGQVCECCFNKRLANLKLVKKNNLITSDQINQRNINDYHQKQQQIKEQQEDNKKQIEKRQKQNYYQALNDKRETSKQKQQDERIHNQIKAQQERSKERDIIEYQKMIKNQMQIRHNQDLQSQIDFKHQKQEQERLRSKSNADASYWRFIEDSQADRNKRVDNQKKLVQDSWQDYMDTKNQYKSDEKQKLIDDAKIMSQFILHQKEQEKGHREYQSHQQAQLSRDLQRQIQDKKLKKEQQTKSYYSQQKEMDLQINQEKNIIQYQYGVNQRQKTQVADGLKNQMLEKQKRIKFEKIQDEKKEMINQLYQISKSPVTRKQPCEDCTKTFPIAKLSFFV